jgi:hypothetical protein
LWRFKIWPLKEGTKTDGAVSEDTVYIQDTKRSTGEKIMRGFMIWILC